MREFYRGARIAPKPTPSVTEVPLTFGEAAFVMADVAHRDRLTEERFIELMRRAFGAYKRVTEGKDGGQ